MAWISVDQSLIGDRLRSLHKAIGCSRNEALGILVNLWLWGIDKTDDEDTLLSIDMNDIEEQLTIGLSKGLDPGQIANILLEFGIVVKEGGDLKMPDLPVLGKQFLRAEKKKASHTEYMRDYRAKRPAEKSCDIHGDVHSDTHSVDCKEKPTKKRKAESKYGDDFEKLWAIYPRKDRKSEAFKAYMARVKEGHSPESMLQAAQTYAAECQRERREQKYTLMGKTFLGPNLVFRDHMPAQSTPQRSAIDQKIRNGENPFL